MENKIIIDNKLKNSFITCSFNGNKEEIILNENQVLLWCQEYDEYEEWLRLDIRNNHFLKKYLSNEETLLNLIKESDLYLYKRYYSEYNKFVFDTHLSFEDAQERKLVLPNEKANLGYNFLDKYAIAFNI